MKTKDRQNKDRTNGGLRLSRFNKLHFLERMFFSARNFVMDSTF